jgi:hypothetical protein
MSNNAPAPSRLLASSAGPGALARRWGVETAFEGAWDSGPTPCGQKTMERLEV